MFGMFEKSASEVPWAPQAENLKKNISNGVKVQQGLEAFPLSDSQRVMMDLLFGHQEVFKKEALVALPLFPLEKISP